MTIFFWNAQGVTYVHRLQGGSERSQNSVMLNSWQKFGKVKVLLLYDHALAHTSAVATDKLIEFGYEILLHSTFYPDLVLCDFFCFFVYKFEKLTWRTEKFESSGLFSKILIFLLQAKYFTIQLFESYDCVFWRLGLAIKHMAAIQVTLSQGIDSNFPAYLIFRN